MPIAASELMAEAACYKCAGVSTAQAFILALERRWLLAIDPDADTSPSALVTYSKCFCAVNSSMFDKFQSALLGMIAEAQE